MINKLIDKIRPGLGFEYEIKSFLKYRPLWRIRSMRRKTMDSYRCPSDIAGGCQLDSLLRTVNYRRKPYEKFPKLENLRVDKYIPEVVTYCFNVIQRGRYGYTQQDLWNLHDYLSEWLPMAIAELATIDDGDVRGIPGSFTSSDGSHIFNEDHDMDLAAAEWQETLMKMADGFRAVTDLTQMHYHSDSRRSELEVQRDEGLALFVKHFESLWD